MTPPDYFNDREEWDALAERKFSFLVEEYNFIREEETDYTALEYIKYPIAINVTLDRKYVSVVCGLYGETKLELRQGGYAHSSTPQAIGKCMSGRDFPFEGISPNDPNYVEKELDLYIELW